MNWKTPTLAAIALALGCNGAVPGAAKPAASSTTAPGSTTAPTMSKSTGARTPLTAPTVVSIAVGTTVTWDEAGRGGQGYVLTLDTDGDPSNGTWTLTVPTGTT